MLDEIEARFPKLLRRVGGYNIDMIDDAGHNMAHLLVGSEGTLGFFTAIELDLQPIPPNRVLGICHFPNFHRAMAATKAIVALGPSAVRAGGPHHDRAGARDPHVPAERRALRPGQARGAAARRVRGRGRGGEPPPAPAPRSSSMGDLGFPGAVIEATDDAFQSQVWEVRAHGLNIMMSMKGDGKPISFIEDCAVPLDDLADYTARLERNLQEARHLRHLVCAPPSVGTLHVRPVLNLKQELEVKKMRRSPRRRSPSCANTRARIRASTGDGIVRSGIPRGDVQLPPRARFRGGEGYVRSGLPLQSRQDRAALSHG